MRDNLCACCGKRFYAGEVRFVSSLYRSGEAWFLCGDCNASEEEAIDLAGTNNIPRLLETYNSAIVTISRSLVARAMTRGGRLTDMPECYKQLETAALERFRRVILDPELLENHELVALERAGWQEDKPTEGSWHFRHPDHPNIHVRWSPGRSPTAEYEGDEDGWIVRLGKVCKTCGELTHDEKCGNCSSS